MIVKKNKKSKSLRKSFFQFLGILLILFVIGFLIISNLRIRQERIELGWKAEFLRREIRVLEDEIQDKKAGILELKTEDYLERIARERFHLARPGEHKVIILSLDEEEEIKEEQIKQEKSFLEKILEKLKF